MGCGNSSPTSSSDNSDSGHAGFTPVKRPKISVVVGSGIKKLSEGPRIIFIFGGPGSWKGRIVDDLCSMFGFHAISCERLILDEWQSRVPKAVADGILHPKNAILDDPGLASTRNAQDLLRQDSSELTLHWLLTRVGQMVEKEEKSANPPSAYIVDFIPNWKFLLKMESLMQPNPTMQLFEDKYAVAFALNLTIPADKLRQRIATQKSARAGKRAGEPGTGSEQQSDEADSSRTEKRAAAYSHMADPWIQYFCDSQRLVTVDVSLGVADLIWERVCNFFISLNVQPRKTVNTVVLFGFSEQAFKHLHLDGIKMTVVKLNDLVVNADASEEELLRSLCKLIDSCNTGHESFAVDTVGTCLGPSSLAASRVTKKAVAFLEADEATLDRYIYMGVDNKSAKTISKKGPQYTAVSTTEKEVCLFPPETNSDLCVRVARLMQQHRISS